MCSTEATECGISGYLHTYFDNINRVSLLSAEEERALAEAIGRDDSDARRRMIQANLRLVVKIAREYMRRGLSLDDLIAEGNLGLIRAVELFDPRFGTRFCTYASYWIKMAIRRAVIDATTMIRLPNHTYRLMSRWRRAERFLRGERGCEPTFDEVVAHLGLTESERSLLSKANMAARLKLESGLGDDETPWIEDCVMDNLHGPETALELSDDLAEIRRRMNRLDERERLVVSLRFGLEGELPQTFREIGRRLGVTGECVRHIELRAEKKLLGARKDIRPLDHQGGKPRDSHSPSVAERFTEKPSRAS
jgi:RNA polymerase primary sigma factor